MVSAKNLPDFWVFTIRRIGLLLSANPLDDAKVRYVTGSIVFHEPHATFSPIIASRGVSRFPNHAAGRRKKVCPFAGSEVD